MKKCRHISFCIIKNIYIVATAITTATTLWSCQLIIIAGYYYTVDDSNSIILLSIVKMKFAQLPDFEEFVSPSFTSLFTPQTQYVRFFKLH